MNYLNYHHFYYFWVVAQEMSITQASKRLRLSQSTISAQIQELEDQLGHPLFHRVKKRLKLTESGKIALDYANTIFKAGEEMLDVFQNRPVAQQKQVVRIGAVSYLSKNLQIEFATPTLRNPDLRLVMVGGSLPELLRDLKNHALDLILSNTPARSEDAEDVFNHSLGSMPAYLVGCPKLSNRTMGLSAAIQLPLILPTRASRLRSEFDAMLEAQRLRYEMKAEVEDMALLRLFALSGEGLALVPEIVVRAELKNKQLRKVARVPGVQEKFYAITASRKFPNPWVEKMVHEFSKSLR